MHAVDCAASCGQEQGWEDATRLDFTPNGPGEVGGPSRWAPLTDYRIRAGDELRLFFVLSRKQTDGNYRLMVGDSISVDSLSVDDLRASVASINKFTILPDGTVTVRLVGEVQAAGLTVEQLRKLLEKRYAEFYVDPKIDVLPISTNTQLTDLRDAIGGASGLNQQSVTIRVALDGKIRLPRIGAVCVQGMTLDQLKAEVNLRYREIVTGLEVEPLLAVEAPHFIYVLGEVNNPGRFQIQTPTTALAGLALAGGHRVGGNLRQVVVMRRADDWRLLTTMLDVRGAVLGKRPTPADEIWLRDGDVVIVPAMPIRVMNNFIRLVFTEGIYGVIPFQGISINAGNNQ